MQTYVYLIFYDNYPEGGKYPTLWEVYRTRAGAEKAAADYNKAKGENRFWVSSVKVTQR